MKIAVIGGSGFVGTRLLDLLREGNEVINIDKQHSHFHNDITIIADVRNKNDISTHLKGCEAVILLAAEHRDDVMPVSLYYDVNVTGMKNVLQAMQEQGIKQIVFTSTVAVYGLNKQSPDEKSPTDPFNHYGKSKWQAEQLLAQWYDNNPDLNISILRPTVIFGERNRGNVYNLLRQISSGRFLMIGNGRNKKSMAYVGNVVAFINHIVNQRVSGYEIYNYVDTPDFNMNQLVDHVGNVLDKRIPSVRFPFWLGMAGGYGFDLLAAISRKKLSISSIRVRKFCATTQFDASKTHQCGFVAPYTLGEGLQKTIRYEFIEPIENKDNITFKTE